MKKRSYKRWNLLEWAGLFIIPLFCLLLAVGTPGCDGWDSGNGWGSVEAASWRAPEKNTDLRNDQITASASKPVIPEP